MKEADIRDKLEKQPNAVGAIAAELTSESASEEVRKKVASILGKGVMSSDIDIALGIIRKQSRDHYPAYE